MGKYKVLIFPAAKRDLQEIIDYINDQSSFDNYQLYDEIAAQIASLEELPFRFPLTKNPVLAQESGRVLGELIEPGYLENYVPDNMKDVIPAQFQNPLVFSFITKVFAYNSETYHFPPVNNIWELTEPEWKGKSYFKDPFQEGVNASFLTMLTSPAISKKIEEAYEKHYGKKLELTTENAGYEWIKAFFQNDVVLFNSDTRVNEAIGVKGNQIDAVGLYVYSKLRERETKDD